MRLGSPQGAREGAWLPISEPRDATSTVRPVRVLGSGQQLLETPAWGLWGASAELRAAFVAPCQPALHPGPGLLGGKVSASRKGFRG